MSILANPNEPLAIGLEVTDDELILSLADGRKLSVPIAWYPRLANATAARAGEGRAFGVSAPLVTDRSILLTMKIATGKVIGGKFVVEGVTLEEGTSVTVLARDGEGGFTLSPEEEAELLLSIAEADRGETVSAEVVLAKLAHRHG